MRVVRYVYLYSLAYGGCGIGFLREDSGVGMSWGLGCPGGGVGAGGWERVWVLKGNCADEIYDRA